MEVKILNYEKNVLEFEIDGVEYTIPELLTGKLSANESVEFVSYKVEHPLIGRPRIIVKTKNKNALDVTLDALDEIKKDIAEFKKAFQKSS